MHADLFGELKKALRIFKFEVWLLFYKSHLSEFKLRRQVVVIKNKGIVVKTLRHLKKVMDEGNEVRGIRIRYLP